MNPEPRSDQSFEQRFERWRKTLGIPLAPLAFTLLWLMPFSGLNMQAHRLLAVFGLVVVLWITEAIPLAVTALLGPSLAVVCGVMSEREMFRSFGNPILFLFLGSFLVAEGMLRHGLNRRIAFALLGTRWAARTPGRVLGAFAGITALLSMWISNTAATAMMFPIALAILSEMAQHKSQAAGRKVAVGELRFGTGLMLATAFAASIGGMATPVGTPPNLIGIGFAERMLGRHITFFQWMCFGVILAAFLTAFLAFYLNRTCPAESCLPAVSPTWMRSQALTLGPLKRAEKNVLLAFGVTVVLWVLPGAFAVLLGTTSPIYEWMNSRVPEGVAALLGATLLFLLPADWSKREFTLEWKDARNVDWGTIMLFGGGLALGGAMFSTGLAKWMGEGLAATFNVHSSFGLIVLFAVLAVVLTETTSNTAAANMMVPVAIAVSQSAGVDPIQPVIAVCLSSSLAFMLPVSTPPNAIVFGSGCVPILAMIRHGFVMDFVSVAGVVAVVYWIVPLVIGHP